MIRAFLLSLTLCLHLAASPTDLTAISYNVRYDASGDKGDRDWKQRRDQVTGYLLSKKASVIGLQEVLHNQLLDIRKALPHYQMIGVGRSDGKKRGEYSPLFYDTRVWKPDTKEKGTFWLSDTPDTPNSKSWGNSLSRICTWVRLIHVQNKQAIYVYNTHWDHRSQPSREKAAELILKKIRTRIHSHDPFILMGDFNATTDNPSIKTLLTSGLLTDPGKKQWRTFNHWKAALVPGLRIDHIFVSTHWKKASAIVEANANPPGSDHHPVVLHAPTP